MNQDSHTLRLGTRGSLLARKQSGMVADELMNRHPGLRVELIIVKTTGDQIQDRPLHEIGGKGLFTKELEQALMNREVDFAVHSFKDVPVTMPLVDISALVFAAVPKREDPRDLLVSIKARRIADLPRGARVGTTSLRRRCQLLSLRRDLQIEPIRGNIDTRLQKMRDGAFDAIILAAAGMKRSGLFDEREMSFIDENEMLPAAGQGALAIQCRADAAETRRLLSVLNDPESAECVAAERRIVQALEGDCHSPIAAWARMRNGQMALRAVVGSAGGKLPLARAFSAGKIDDDVVRSVISELLDQNVHAMLHPVE